MGPQMKRDDLIKLTNLWYKKLEDSGFDDIEFYNKRTGYGQDSRYTKDLALSYKWRYNEFTAQHYRLCENFLSHYDFPNKKDKFIFSLYTAGLTFREIIAKCKKKGGSYAYNHKKKPNISLFSLHHKLKRYIALCHKWNLEHPDGIHLAEADTKKAMGIDTE